MSRSISALTPSALSALASRSQVTCVVYNDHLMPAGTEPSVAQVGVESDEEGVKLFVQRGLSYRGSLPQVAEWLNAGSMRFNDLEALVNWVALVIPTQASPDPNLASRTNDARPSALPVGSVTRIQDVVVEPSAHKAVFEADLSQILQERIAGQEHAVTVLASRIALHTGKEFPRKPYSAMLIGPTGSGKTTMAEVIAEALATLGTDSGEFIRLDMSEYSEKHSVSRLTGAPPGYIGYGDECLASRLARSPNSVVLFDEIEKAHTTVLFALMNLIDKGRLDSDRYGSINASKSILIFTSNLGVSKLRGARLDEKAARLHLLQQGLAPEIVGRFANVVTFNDLGTNALAEIAARSVSTIAADYGVQIAWIDPNYLSNLLQRLEGNILGVRAIEYLIDTELGEQFAALESKTAQVTFDDTALVVPCSIESHHGQPAPGDQDDVS